MKGTSADHLGVILNSSLALVPTWLAITEPHQRYLQNVFQNLVPVSVPHHKIAPYSPLSTQKPERSSATRNRTILMLPPHHCHRLPISLRTKARLCSMACEGRHCPASAGSSSPRPVTFPPLRTFQPRGSWCYSTSCSHPRFPFSASAMPSFVLIPAPGLPLQRSHTWQSCPTRSVPCSLCPWPDLRPQNAVIELKACYCLTPSTLLLICPMRAGPLAALFITAAPMNRAVLTVFGKRLLNEWIA